MIYTNTELHGSKFLDIIDEQCKNARDITIASGYTSLDILQRYQQAFIATAERGGVVRLLVGMAFYEGLSQRKLDLLNTLSRQLQQINPKNGVYVCYTRKYHGKIYFFNNDAQTSVYIGSSNFSRSGLSENIEATFRVSDSSEISRIANFLEYMFSPEVSTHITNADIVVPGSASFKKKISIETLNDLQRYDPQSIDAASLEFFDYSLARIAKSEKSSLNVYFGKGRWTRSTGKILPRDWYEVELIAKKELTSQDIYPKGNFTVYTDDGYVLPMRTSGDNFKNIRSRGNLKLLGMWIKKKLQDAGALTVLTPVTQDTLDQYGTEHIRFYKISDTKYYAEF